MKTFRCADCGQMFELTEERARNLQYEIDCPNCGGYACNWQFVCKSLEGATQPDQRRTQSIKNHHQRDRPESVGELSEQSIKRQLLKDAIQHPSVLVPFTIYGIAMVYLLLLSPILRGRSLALGISIAAGIAVIFALLWRYSDLYRREYGSKVKEMMEHRDRARKRAAEAQVRVWSENLRSGFINIKCGDGLKILTQLTAEFEFLQDILMAGSQTDPISITLLHELAANTYRQGLGVLSDALDLNTAARSSTARLKKDIAELQKEIQAVKDNGNQSQHLKIKEEMLASHVQRLKLLDQIDVRAEQLLYQAGRCEDTIHRTRLELVTMRTGDSETNVNSVIESLQMTIRQAGEVQRELRNLGY